MLFLIYGSDKLFANLEEAYRIQQAENAQYEIAKLAKDSTFCTRFIQFHTDALIKAREHLRAFLEEEGIREVYTPPEITLPLLTAGFYETPYTTMASKHHQSFTLITEQFKNLRDFIVDLGQRYSVYQELIEPKMEGFTRYIIALENAAKSQKFLFLNYELLSLAKHYIPVIGAIAEDDLFGWRIIGGKRVQVPISPEDDALLSSKPYDVEQQPKTDFHYTLHAQQRMFNWASALILRVKGYATDEEICPSRIFQPRLIEIFKTWTEQAEVPLPLQSDTFTGQLDNILTLLTEHHEKFVMFMQEEQACFVNEKNL